MSRSAPSHPVLGSVTKQADAAGKPYQPYLDHISDLSPADQQQLLSVPKAEVLQAVLQLEACRRCRFVRHVLSTFTQPQAPPPAAPHPSHSCPSLSPTDPDPAQAPAPTQPHPDSCSPPGGPPLCPLPPAAAGWPQAVSQASLLLPYLFEDSSRHRLANLLQFVWHAPSSIGLQPSLFQRPEGTHPPGTECPVSSFLTEALGCVEELRVEVGDCSRHCSLPGPDDIQLTEQRLEALLQGAVSSLRSLGVLRGAQHSSGGDGRGGGLCSGSSSSSGGAAGPPPCPLQQETDDLAPGCDQLGYEQRPLRPGPEVGPAGRTSCCQPAAAAAAAAAGGCWSPAQKPRGRPLAAAAAAAAATSPGSRHLQEGQGRHCSAGPLQPLPATGDEDGGEGDVAEEVRRAASGGAELRQLARAVARVSFERAATAPSSWGQGTDPEPAQGVQGGGAEVQGEGEGGGECSPLNVLALVDEGVVASLPEELQRQVRGLQREVLQVHQRQARIHKARQHGMEAAAKQLLLLLLRCLWARVVRSFHAAAAEHEVQRLLLVRSQQQQQQQQAGAAAEAGQRTARGCGGCGAAHQFECKSNEPHCSGTTGSNLDGPGPPQGLDLNPASSCCPPSPAAAAGGCACCQGGACCPLHLEWELEKLELRGRGTELEQELICAQTECDSLVTELSQCREELSRSQVRLGASREELSRSRTRLDGAQEALQRAQAELEAARLAHAAVARASSPGAAARQAGAGRGAVPGLALPDEAALKGLGSRELEGLERQLEAALQRIRAAHVQVAALEREACPVCWVEARGVVFACGHSTCIACGDKLSACPICRLAISLRIRMY